MKKRGRRKYVPGEVLVRIEQIKRNHNLKTDADGFRFMAKAADGVNQDLLGNILYYFKHRKGRKRR